MSKGPVHSEIEKRLTAELSPISLNVINDSARMVNKALGDMMRDKVHAMVIQARAPGE